VLALGDKACSDEALEQLAGIAQRNGWFNVVLFADRLGDRSH
jgi:hypothetical protein